MSPLPTPQRIDIVSELALTIRDSIPHLAKYRQDRHSKAQVLAMCEIAMSLPPFLFTPMERVDIVRVVTEVYGDPYRFLETIADERGSFVAQCPEECSGKSTDGIIEGVIKAHREQFGVDLIALLLKD